jgi:hypothetical protein
MPTNPATCWFGTRPSAAVTVFCGHDHNDDAFFNFFNSGDLPDLFGPDSTKAPVLVVSPVDAS